MENNQKISKIIARRKGTNQDSDENEERRRQRYPGNINLRKKCFGNEM
jgi:hypothetical protein